MKRLHLWGASLLALLLATGFAAEPASAVAQLEPVVVTATRTETPLKDSGASATVISRKDIEQKQYRTLTDALRNVPGLSLSQPGTPGQTVTVLNRGLPTRFTSYLIDGKPVPSAFANDGNLTNLTLDNVERIELVRGPLSAVQGGNAVAGAINIITRKGRGLEKNLEGEATLEAGSYNTFREAVSARGAVDKFFYSAAASRLDTSFQRENNDYENTNSNINLGYEATPDLTFELATDYRAALSGNPGTRVANNKVNYLLLETWNISPSATWQTTEEWQQVFTYQHAERRQPNRTGTTHARAQIDENAFFHDNTYCAQETLTVTGGWSVQDRKLKNDAPVFVNNHTNTAGQLGLDWQALTGWHILPSVRFDHYSDYGTQTNYRIATSYEIEPTQTILHGSYGTAFNPVEEQNFSFAGARLDPNIRPERSEGFDFGVEQPFFNRKLTAGATYFQNQVQNLVGFNFAAAAPAPNVINSLESRSQGMETFVRVDPYDCLNLLVTYTYTDARNLTGKTRQVRSPEHKVGAEVSYQPISVVNLTLGGDWNMSREDFHPVTFAQVNSEDYFVARFAASWQVQQHCQLFARIENAFQEEYEEVAGFPALDQAIYGGVKLSY